MPVMTGTGGIIRLADVAHISESEVEGTTKAYINDESGIVLTISKQSNANIVDISNEIEKELKKINDEYAEIDVFMLTNTSSYIKVSVKNVLQTAIISNCSSEEVNVLKESQLYGYFDEVILSYEVHMKKPDSCIYEEAAKRLDVALEECIFVGDGGSNELVGAKGVGMKAIQAKWYTNQLPKKHDTVAGFLVAEEPLDIIEYIE
jgi:HAD superfamily hydrolase (TIGR01549 family)